MKKSLIFIVFILSITISFVFGAKVGSGKMWVYSRSLDANKASQDIRYRYSNFESVKEFKNYLDDEYYSDIHEDILSYGRYLNHWSSRVPVLMDLDDNMKTFYKEAITFYLDTRYQPPKLSPEESVSKTMNEMLAEGEIEKEFVEDISKDLLDNITEQNASFERAINYVSQ